MRQSASSNTLWTDAELADAVDAYVFMLRAQAVGVICRKEAAASAVLEEGLPQRNDASLRYRFRNISAVAEDMGGPILAGYSPAGQVGSGVRERIRDLLTASQHFNDLLSAQPPPSIGAPSGPVEPSSAALDALAALRQRLDEVEREFLGIGHNNPPEPISSAPDRRAAFDEARSDITALEAEMVKPVANAEVVADRSERLLQFGVKMMMWVGQRTTKFVDVALAALAPALVIKVTGLLPVLIEALGAVARAGTH